MPTHIAGGSIVLHFVLQSKSCQASYRRLSATHVSAGGLNETQPHEHVRAEFVAIRAAKAIGNKTRIDSPSLMEFLFTKYFETQVLRKRPYILKEWCIAVVLNPAYGEAQERGRFRYWAPVAKLDGRYLRVVTLADKVTIHNAFPDRGFSP